MKALGMNAQRLPFLFASILLAACGTVVSNGGGGPDDTNPGITDDVPSHQLRPAVSLTRAQNDILWDEYWEGKDPSGSTSSGGGGDLDPNDLFLHLADVGVSCGSPTAELPCGGHFEMTLVLPPDLQQVGVYDLEDPKLIAYSSMSETGEPHAGDPKDCPWGGGSLGAGSLEIIAIDATEVHFKVTLQGGLWTEDPSGEYVAPRCPSDD